jgi:polyhydroxyalkanoate synthesis repressor PhaR|tara:strand:+ start:1261 stop:1737 length:477 start_codon:yes stop_codon:yes gene_type:complete
MTENLKRVIKKYPNRRLYDTEESRYVTLCDIRKLVVEEVGFCVIDKKTGDDLTRSILLQIITEQEDCGEPLFTIDALEKIIGFYGKSVQALAGESLCESINIFREQQEKIQSQLTEALKLNPVTAPLTEMTKKNLEVWNQMQAQFFKQIVDPESDPKK